MTIAIVVIGSSYDQIAFFYMDHITTNLTHIGHTEYSSGSKWKGIKSILVINKNS
jgi:hypothetical protein